MLYYITCALNTLIDCHTYIYTYILVYICISIVIIMNSSKNDSLL